MPKNRFFIIFQALKQLEIGKGIDKNQAFEVWVLDREGGLRVLSAPF